MFLKIFLCIYFYKDRKMMRNRNIGDIIKEEIHNFNFLSNDEVLKEQDEVNVLRSEDFQKRFISNNEKEIFEVSKYIKNTNNIIHSTLIYHHIQVEILTPEVPLYVFGFANDFSLVILNILNNSKDAFIKKNIEKPKITIKSNINEDYALITITDNAGGVKKNILNKIFEIHFSTKLKDEVSGLGLYISKLIIENKFLGNIDAQNTSDGLKVTIKIKVKAN